MYKHVLFDMDGTLVNTYHANLGSLVSLLDKYSPGHGKTKKDLEFIFGIPGDDGLRALGFTNEQIPAMVKDWLDIVKTRSHDFTVYEGIIPVLSYLKNNGVKMAIVTSRTRNIDMGGPLGGTLPEVFRPYIDFDICAGDTPRPKPSADPINHYIDRTHAKREEVLFIGDTPTDLEAAHAAGVDFGLALWGYAGHEHLYCKHYLRSPWNIVNLVTSKNDDTSIAGQLHRWAREINAIGMCGRTYSKDRFDIERFERLQEIACEMASTYVDESIEVIRKQWIQDARYKTPQLDTRAAIFDEEGRILMVKEKLSNKWSLPGGWCDENCSAVENTLKEVREEACMTVVVTKFVALLDRARHNEPDTLSGCLKVFLECKAGPGEFVDNIETSERRFFKKEEIPTGDDLRSSTNSYDQIMMCFAAHNDPNWKTIVE